MGWIPTRARPVAASVAALAAALIAASPAVAAPEATPPTATILGPSAGSTLAGQVAFTADATDASGVARVEFSVDGALRWTERYAPYVFNGDGQKWNTTLEANGLHKISIKAIDKRGNATVVSRSVTIANGVVDTTAPTVAISAPATGTVSGVVPYSATASDTAGIARVEFRVDGTLKTTDTTLPFGIAAGWDTSSVADGSHTLKVTAIDTSGNAASASKAVTVANEEPAPAPPPSSTPPPAPAPAPAPSPAPDAAASVFVSTTGSDSAACTVSAPCRSFDRAYRVAQPGQVVEVAAGSYGTQNIGSDATKTSSSDVIIRPASGADVSVSGVNTDHTAHLELRGMKVTTFSLYVSEDITLRDLDTRNGFMKSGKDLRMIGGDVGPYNICASGCSSAGLSIALNDPSLARTQNVTIDGVYFHDITRDPGEHGETMSVWSADHVVIRNSKFNKCPVFCISIDRLHNPLPTQDITIENNWIDCGSDCSANIGYWAYDMLVRNNSFRSKSFTPFDTAQTAQWADRNVRFVANVGGDVGGNCSFANQTFSYNVWNGSKCSATDINAPEGYVNGAGFDFHLQPGAAAINHGDPLSFPSLDIDGTARPMGGIPDAGASEKA